VVEGAVGPVEDVGIRDGRVAARESDHDPVLVGLKLDRTAPTLLAATPADIASASSALTCHSVTPVTWPFRLGVAKAWSRAP
jgi:hypothetical protein